MKIINFICALMMAVACVINVTAGKAAWAAINAALCVGNVAVVFLGKKGE